MAWITPKLDWKATDYFNADDLNRIENNTAEVVAYLQSIDFAAPDITTVTGRTMLSIDYLSSINRVEQNIQAIIDDLLYQSSLITKAWTQKLDFDYQDANRLENNLYLLYTYSQRAAACRVYCGTFACGEEVLIYAVV